MFYFDIISWSSTDYSSNNSKINVSNATITGNNNKIKGDNNTISGNNLKVIGHKNVIRGNNLKVTGDFNEVVGNNCKVTGYGCIVRGNNNKHTPVDKTYEESITEILDNMLEDAKRDGEELEKEYIIDGKNYRGGSPRAAVELYKAEQRRKDKEERERISEMIKEDSRKWKIDNVKLTDEEYDAVEQYMEENKHIWQTWSQI